MSTYQASWSINGGTTAGHLDGDNMADLQRQAARIVRGNMSRGDRALVLCWGADDDRPVEITYTRSMTGRITQAVTC